MKALRMSSEEVIHILNCIIPRTVHDIPTNLHDRVKHLKEYREIPMV